VTDPNSAALQCFVVSLLLRARLVDMGVSSLLQLVIPSSGLASHGWVFPQLIVFSSLAAFTHDFDITNGIVADKNEGTTDQLLVDTGVNN
jgi:hypothetical protein